MKTKIYNVAINTTGTIMNGIYYPIPLYVWAESALEAISKALVIMKPDQRDEITHIRVRKVSKNLREYELIENLANKNERRYQNGKLS